MSALANAEAYRRPPGVLAEVVSSATIDESGRYRYRLARRWGEGPSVVWVMLNPSTADADVDDATIRRVRVFTRTWGYHAFEVVNLYALRSRYPQALFTDPDPIGRDNDEHICEASQGAALTIAAWGAHPMAEHRVEAVLPLLDAPHCLGTTKSGAPRHPLYAPGVVTPVRWDMPA